MSNNKKTVLVIDDELDILDLCKDVLIDEYNVLIASNGAIGIEMAMRLNIDVIITDLKMPFVDGFEVCRKCKERAPIVVMTGVFDIAPERFTKLRVLRKPMNISDIQVAVRETINEATKKKAA